MSKMFFLIAHFLKKRFFSKTFLLTNIIFFIVSLLVILLPSYYKNPPPKVMKINHPVQIRLFCSSNVPLLKQDALIKLYKEQLNLKENNELSVALTTIAPLNPTLFPALAQKNKAKIAIYYYPGEGDNLQAYYYTNYYAEALNMQISTLIEKTNYHLKGANAITLTSQNTFKDHDLEQEIRQKQVIPIFLIGYMAITIAMLTMSFQTSGNDVINEKNARIIEQIMMNISSGKHFYAKVIGAFCFTLVQMLLFITYGLIGILMGPQDLASSAYVIGNYKLFGPMIFALLNTILGSLMAGVIAVVLAALSNSQEEYNQISAPFLVLITLAFYLGLFLTNNASQFNLLRRLLSYLPVISLFIAPMSYLVGGINLLGVIIALLTNILFIEYFSLFVFPQYKDSLLNYDNKNRLFTRLFTNLANRKRRPKK